MVISVSSNPVTLDAIRSESPVSPCSDCSEEGCRIQLDRMSERVVIRPDEEDGSGERADCAIFFPDENNQSSSLYRNDTAGPIEADYLAVVELKNTVSNPDKIEQQIEGALDFAIEVLQSCQDPNWQLRCFCLVCKNRTRRYNKPISKIRIRKNICGEMYIFRPIPVDSGESLRDVMEWERVEDTMRDL